MLLNESKWLWSTWAREEPPSLFTGRGWAVTLVVLEVLQTRGSADDGIRHTCLHVVDNPGSP